MIKLLAIILFTFFIQTMQVNQQNWDYKDNINKFKYSTIPNNRGNSPGITDQQLAYTTSEFISKKVQIGLLCKSDETVIGVNFTQPFKGVVLAGDTNSRCKIRGDGHLSYVLHVPHNSCGTQHVISKGSFVNKLFIRFHPSLEMGGDLSKTIVCKFGTGSITVS